MAPEVTACSDYDFLPVGCRCGEIYGFILELADTYHPIPPGFVLLPTHEEQVVGWVLIACPACDKQVQEGADDNVISGTATSTTPA